MIAEDVARKFPAVSSARIDVDDEAASEAGRPRQREGHGRSSHGTCREGTRGAHPLCQPVQGDGGSVIRYAVSDRSRRRRCI